MERDVESEMVRMANPPIGFLRVLARLFAGRGFLGKMMRLVEGHERGGRLQHEFADRAVVHHSIPASVIAVEENTEGDRERAAMGDDDDTFALVLVRDAPQCARESVTDLFGRLATVRAEMRILVHVLEEFSIVVQRREGFAFPATEIVFHEIRIDFRRQPERSADGLCSVVGAVEGARVDAGDRCVIRLDPSRGRRGLLGAVRRKGRIRRAMPDMVDIGRGLAVSNDGKDRVVLGHGRRAYTPEPDATGPRPV